LIARLYIYMEKHIFIYKSKSLVKVIVKLRVFKASFENEIIRECLVNNYTIDDHWDSIWSLSGKHN